PRGRPLRAAPGRAPGRPRLLQPRGYPPARRRPDPRLGGRRDPRRTPLLPAADGPPWRRRHEPRELLPLHDPRGNRPPRQRTAPGQQDLRHGKSETGPAREKLVDDLVGFVKL